MRYTITSLFIALFLSSGAQTSWKFEHLTSDDGLSSGIVNCVFKDSRGFIWIGTSDGLNRYDGYSLTLFKNDKNDTTSISGNIINTIMEDPRGRIWIGTRNNGISIFDWQTETFTRMTSGGPEGLPKGAVRKLVTADQQQILVGMQEGGLCVYHLEDQSFKVFRSQPNDPTTLSNDDVFSIIKAADNLFWVSTHSGGVDRFDLSSGQFERFVYDEGYDNTESNRKPLFQDKNGILWIGTDGDGLVRFDPMLNQFKQYSAAPGQLNSGMVTAIYEDIKGKIFIGTDGGGINVLDPETDEFNYIKSNLLDPESLSSDAIYDIYEDDSGVIWISTFRGGVNTYSPYRNKFRLYKQIPLENNSLSFSSVIDVLETRDGYIWIGTDGGGLDRLDPKTGSFRHYKHDPNDPTSLSTNVAISLLEDQDGYLWVGTYAGGLNRFDRRNGVVRRFLPDPADPTSINNRNVWSILEDSRGTLWFGILNGGLDKFDKESESFTHYTSSEAEGSLSSNLIFTMMEDSKNNFWIGTEDAGLNLFDRDAGTFTVFKHSEEDSTTLLNNTIRTLFEDSKGNLWIGTSEGVNIMDPSTKSISSSPVNKQLAGLMINGIQEDQEGNIWIATNKGLSKYHPIDNRLQHFSMADGLQGNEFNYTASVKTRDGTMYFGGVKGLNVFHPSEVKSSAFMPNMVITSIHLFDVPINDFTTKNGAKIITGSVQNLEKLILNYDQNVFEIGFASLDYTSPQSNKYRYQLEGFDKDWIYTTASKRTANYTNLDPGSYTFRVQGTNSDGIWSDKERTLSIYITPPWWTTWWFRGLVIILMGSTGFLFFRWRIRSAHIRNQDLNQRIEEATYQMKAQNETLHEEQLNLSDAIADTNYVIGRAVESGDFSARINLDNKTGEWRNLGASINNLFDSILTPFNAINELIDAMATSDLSKRYEQEAKGDVRKITDNLNHALDNLSELLREIIRNMQGISQASEDMLVSSQEMNVGTGEIASSTSELSRGAQEQVSRIDQASHILENILKFSANVGEQAQSINEAAEKGATISDEGKSQMNNMDLSMQKMLTASIQSNEAIGALSEKSTKISGMLNSIKEIAVETNMLALNAAIEAAKAGDAGRGFAVVADQIRKLAENSSHFALEIEYIIKEVQASIDRTHHLISEMGADIEGGVKSSKHASHSFDALAASYAQTLGISNQIVIHAGQQYQKIKEVVKLMEAVVVISEQAAAGTEQMASSSNELSAGMTEYAEKAKRVTSIIETLNEKMKQFQLKGDG